MTRNGFPPMVIMGVSGSGKSTVGALLAQTLGGRFIDGDDLHPARNKEKMGAGVPLEDDDRWPWLEAVGQALRSRQSNGSGVTVACSALKRRYRDLLRKHAPEAVFVHLVGSAETLAARMASRDHEFMPVTLLASQLEALEALEPDEFHVLLDVRKSPSELVEDVMAAVNNGMVPVPGTPTGE